MKIVARTWRLFQIVLILMRYALDEWLYSLSFLKPFRFLTYLNPYYWWGGARCMSRGQRLRLALEDLGPIFIKFGQSLSTRCDLFPRDIILELTKLQNEVPVFSSVEAQRLIEQSLGKKIDSVFDNFDVKPLASASIAQVHSAQLKTGEAVVIKVLRPGIGKKIERDIDWLYQLACLIERYWFHGRQLKPRELVCEFKQCLLDELDLMKEAANASQLRRNFENSDLLYIPKVYWEYTNGCVLVMERISGISISDTDRLRACQINFKSLAERGVEIFFTQVFRDCFFHADMHPGNIFVSMERTSPPQYIGVDFGIVGSLNPFDQRYLAENLLAFFKRDYRRVAELHVESGWVSSDTRINELENAIRTVCEPIFERPLHEISFAHLLLRLFQTARRFNMAVQPQFMLLQKTLFNVEGLGRQLYPELDLWHTAKPLLERWLKKQIGLQAFFRKIRYYAPYWAERLPEVPDLIYDVLAYWHARKKRLVALPKSVTQKKYSSPSRLALGISSLGVGLFLLLVSVWPWVSLFWIGMSSFWRSWITGLIGGGLLLIAFRQISKKNSKLSW